MLILSDNRFFNQASYANSQAFFSIPSSHHLVIHALSIDSSFIYSASNYQPYISKLIDTSIHQESINHPFNDLPFTHHQSTTHSTFTIHLSPINHPFNDLPFLNHHSVTHSTIFPSLINHPFNHQPFINHHSVNTNHQPFFNHRSTTRSTICHSSIITRSPIQPSIHH